MKDLLITLLETWKYGVYQQGSMTGEYPDSFFTFWNNSSDDHHPYDNAPIGWVWNFEVNFYSIDPALVNTILEEVRTLLLQNGFVVVGKGHDVASDEPTHTGRGFTVLYIENNKRS